MQVHVGRKARERERETFTILPAKLQGMYLPTVPTLLNAMPYSEVNHEFRRERGRERDGLIDILCLFHIYILEETPLYLIYP